LLLLLGVCAGLCGGKYDKHHFSFWNLRGCPGLQDGALSCVGNDFCLCCNCSLGCGFAGHVKRMLFRLWVLMAGLVFGVMLIGPALMVGLVCSPCLYWWRKRRQEAKRLLEEQRAREREERRRRRRERAIARDVIDEDGRVLTPEERRERRAKRRREAEEKEQRETEEAIRLSQMEAGTGQQAGGGSPAVMETVKLVERPEREGAAAGSGDAGTGRTLADVAAPRMSHVIEIR
jgi:hypothetical protein